MADPQAENPELVDQHIQKNRMGDKELSQKPGKTPERKQPTPGASQGIPEDVENVEGREEAYDDEEGRLQPPPEDLNPRRTGKF